MALSLEELQKRIGYRFRDLQYLRRAVTHSSYSNETGARNHHLLCNERLEFLGDSVLSLITSEYLYGRFPELPEGDLTRMRAATVCEEALASYAEQIGLGDFLLLGKGESNSGGSRKPAVIADAFEAILAAIYLDAGAPDGLGAVSAFLLPFIKDAVDRLPDAGGYHTDSKSRLQEFVQKDKEQKGQLKYLSAGESGPDHNKTFVVEVYLDSNRIGRGSGHSKKSAEQAAARDALQLFGIED
ncbi:MAG: ribonuclease III [Clostridia bacterium]|nr:ribonuclease III [Clostridia bacterium]